MQPLKSFFPSAQSSKLCFYYNFYIIFILPKSSTITQHLITKNCHNCNTRLSTVSNSSYSLKKKTMSSKFWEVLSNDYEKLFETEIVYDVIIHTRKEPNVKEIHAYSTILCTVLGHNIFALHFLINGYFASII